MTFAVHLRNACIGVNPSLSHPANFQTATNSNQYFLPSVAKISHLTAFSQMLCSSRGPVVENFWLGA